MDMGSGAPRTRPAGGLQLGLERLSCMRGSGLGASGQVAFSARNSLTRATIIVSHIRIYMAAG